jgi:hypothetical protein
MVNKPHLAGTVFLTGILLVGLAARAADRKVHFQVPPDVLEGVAAMPLILNPADTAELRINTALQRLDATVRKAADDCKGSDGKSGWGRSVDVPMRGPGYVSFVIMDDIYCDGAAHPDRSTMSIVYDLSTGAPVDWTRLLPPSLTGQVALQEGADGTKMVSLSSKRLFAFYLDGYHAGNGMSDEECKQIIQDASSDGAPATGVWLDAKTGGLAVQIGLYHAVQACEAAVVIPVATLRAEGANPHLVEAIQAAHQQN